MTRQNLLDKIEGEQRRDDVGGRGRERSLERRAKWTTASLELLGTKPAVTSRRRDTLQHTGDVARLRRKAAAGEGEGFRLASDLRECERGSSGIEQQSI